MPTAREIMHGGAQCVGEHETLQTAARMMRELDVGALPICGDDNRLHGMITDRDVVVKCIATGGDPTMMTAGELAQDTTYWIAADADVDDVVATMAEHQIRRLPVIEDHRLVGMISEADCSRHLSDEQVSRMVAAVYA